jgi:hypothetical protein
MESVIEQICLMRCEGVNAEELFKNRRPYELSKLAAVLSIVGLHHIVAKHMDMSSISLAFTFVR